MIELERIHACNGEIVAIVVKNEFKRDGFNFISESHYPLQVGINSYEKEEKIKPHIHVNRDIKVETLQEVVYIKSGKVKVDLYDSQKVKVRSLILSAGDLVFLVGGGHGFNMLEDTVIFEVKQGPYAGKAQDKVVIS